jgi:hypothetical protein
VINFTCCFGSSNIACFLSLVFSELQVWLTDEIVESLLGARISIDFRPALHFADGAHGRNGQRLVRDAQELLE